MIVSTTQVPTGSLLHPAQPGAWFRDCHTIPLRQPGLAMPQLFHAVFSHHPSWLKRLLILRNRLAARAGLAVPPAEAILAPTHRPTYRVGDTIGPWPIFALTEAELVAGRNNRHLDFRLSVLKLATPAGPALSVTTLCTVHNLAGRLYLSAIIPFHRAGMRMLLARAHRAGRI